MKWDYRWGFLPMIKDLIVKKKKPVEVKKESRGEWITGYQMQALFMPYDFKLSFDSVYEFLTEPDTDLQALLIFPGWMRHHLAHLEDVNGKPLLELDSRTQSDTLFGHPCLFLSTWSVVFPMIAHAKGVQRLGRHPVG